MHRGGEDRGWICKSADASFADPREWRGELKALLESRWPRQCAPFDLLRYLDDPVSRFCTRWGSNASRFSQAALIFVEVLLRTPIAQLLAAATRKES